LPPELVVLESSVKPSLAIYASQALAYLCKTG